jgi:DNA-binding response OmpR family regulator
MGKKKVLIVDDDPVVLEMVRDYLKTLDLEAHTFDRSLGTSNEVARVKPDLVIMDIEMPALKGDKLCEILRQEEDLKDLKILLYSVLDEKELIKIAFNQGADDYLSKSSDMSTLGMKVKKLLLS